jgi:hypothetical protein
VANINELRAAGFASVLAVSALAALMMRADASPRRVAGACRAEIAEDTRRALICHRGLSRLDRSPLLVAGRSVFRAKCGAEPGVWIFGGARGCFPLKRLERVASLEVTESGGKCRLGYLSQAAPGGFDDVNGLYFRESLPVEGLAPVEKLDARDLAANETAFRAKLNESLEVLLRSVPERYRLEKGEPARPPDELRFYTKRALLACARLRGSQYRLKSADLGSLAEETLASISKTDPEIVPIAVRPEALERESD